MKSVPVSFHLAVNTYWWVVLLWADLIYVSQEHCQSIAMMLIDIMDGLWISVWVSSACCLIILPCSRGLEYSLLSTEYHVHLHHRGYYSPVFTYQATYVFSLSYDIIYPDVNFSCSFWKTIPQYSLSLTFSTLHLIMLMFWTSV